MLKFADIPKDTLIRAYDFQPMPGRPDKFIEGVIISENHDQYAGYRVLVTKDSTGSNRTTVKVPMEIGITEFDDRITILNAGSTK